MSSAYRAMRAGTYFGTVAGVDQDLPPLFTRAHSVRFWVTVDAIVALGFATGGFVAVVTEGHAGPLGPH